MVKPSVDKLRELILYVSSRYADDERYTSTRLTKVLFWSDFEYFRETGQAITGSNYIRMPYGPMLERFQGILEAMETRGELRVRREHNGAYTQFRPFAGRSPKMSLFSPEELEVIDRIIAENYGATAASVSDVSHEFIGWQVARQGERIPYGTAWLSTPQVSQEDIQYAEQLAEIFGSE